MVWRICDTQGKIIAGKQRVSYLQILFKLINVFGGRKRRQLLMCNKGKNVLGNHIISRPLETRHRKGTNKINHLICKHDKRIFETEW